MWAQSTASSPQLWNPRPQAISTFRTSPQPPMLRYPWLSPLCTLSWDFTVSNLVLNFISELIYNVMLVPGVQQNDSVTHIHVSILFQITFPFKLLQSLGRVPCVTLYVLILFHFICSSVYVSVPNSQSFPPHLSFSHLVHIKFWLWICFHFVNKYICVNFFFRFHA